MEREQIDACGVGWASGKESRACLFLQEKAFALKRLSLTGLTGCVALSKHANLSEPLLHLQN